MHQLRAAGTTRLSIGVQSFADSALQAIGRGREASTRVSAAETIRQAMHTVGFPNVNVDLIYGLHEQSLDNFLQVGNAQIYSSELRVLRWVLFCRLRMSDALALCFHSLQNLA